MSTPPEPDWAALRREGEQGQSPEWIAKHGEASWEAALVVSGELSQAALDKLTPEERAHYALAPA